MNTNKNESKNILPDVWEITRQHISGEAQGHNQPGLDFHAINFRNDVGAFRYDLADVSRDFDDSEKDKQDIFGAFSWIRVVADKVSSKSLSDEEYSTLELNILRLSAIWAHKHNLRIKTFIEYFQSINDDYVINHILSLELVEKYGEFGINDEQATWLSEKLSGAELELMLNQDLKTIFTKAKLDTERYEKDKFEWLQTIKNILNSISKETIEQKFTMSNESIENANPNSQDAQICEGEIHQVLVMQNERILLSLAYADVVNTGNDPLNDLEVIGCYCGYPADWRYFFHKICADGSMLDHTPTVTEEFEGTTINGVWAIVAQLEEARNNLLDLDENTEIIGLSQAGQDFIESNQVDHGNDDLLLITTPFARLDYIYELQNQWSLQLFLD